MTFARILTPLALIMAIAFCTTNTVAHAQEAAKLKLTPLQKEALTGQPDKEVFTVIVEWPPGSGTGPGPAT